MAPTGRPTFTLSERVGTVCALSDADVDFLLRAHRGHVAVAPTGRRGEYRVTPRGHVGTIVAPGCRFVIRPKVPVRNLFHLLDPDAGLPALEDHADTAAGNEVLDLLAMHLARLMEERLAQGLHRAYVERYVRGPFLQGRLDMSAQVREPLARKDTVHSCYEELTADLPCNQLPKATADLLVCCSLLAPEVKARLALCLHGFANVSRVVLSTASFPRVPMDRLLEPYRPMLDLCRLLAENLAPGNEMADVACPAFLLDMERVFEGYCTRGLLSGLGGAFSIDVQPLFRPGHPAADAPPLWMRPDVVVRREGRPWAVVDAKWKSSAHVQEDLYQVLGYCAALGFPRSMLIYPGKRDRSWQYAFDGICVEVRVLRVTGSRTGCRRSLRAMCRALRRSR